jgi:hypothetical protein
MTRLLPEKGEEKRQENTDDDAGGKGKIKSKVLLFYIDVPWKTTDPGNFIAQNQEDPDPGQN